MTSTLSPVIAISIPSLNIDAPILSVSPTQQKSKSGREYTHWPVPNEFAAGWHDTSAEPGQQGNTVINGHNNIHGAIFKNLVDLTLGQEIILFQGDYAYNYEVVHREFLPEKGESLRTRFRNARWIAPSDDVRLTIMTCWPNTSNSHVLIVIALPITSEADY